MLKLMLCVTTGGEIKRGILNIQQYFLPETTLHLKEFIFYKLNTEKQCTK